MPLQRVEPPVLRHQPHHWLHGRGHPARSGLCQRFFTRGGRQQRLAVAVCMNVCVCVNVFVFLASVCNILVCICTLHTPQICGGDMVACTDGGCTCSERPNHHRQQVEHPPTHTRTSRGDPGGRADHTRTPHGLGDAGSRERRKGVYACVLCVCITRICCFVCV
jgi:hypothetical protein